MRYLIIIIIALMGCNTAKEITRTVTLVDSSAVKTRDSLAVAINNITQTYENYIEQIWSSGVMFDTVSLPAPPMDCDSTGLEHWKTMILSLQNKIKINKDGSIEAQGRIRAVNSELHRVENELSELHSENYILHQVKDSLKVELSKRASVVYRDIRRKFFTSWWVYVLFFGGGIFAGLKLKKYLV